MAAAIIVLFIIGILLGLFFYERSRNLSLRSEQAQLREKLRLSELRKKIAESPTQETKILRGKAGQRPAGQGSPTLGSRGTRMSAISQDCRSCFQDYEYQVEVKDDAGRWIFRDDNIFDNHPGSLTLTDKFWGEIEQGKSAEKTPPAVAKPPRLKNRVLVGFELDRYKVEYAYSPLGLRTNKLDLGLSLYSSLAMSYASAPLEARAGIGLEVRF